MSIVDQSEVSARVLANPVPERTPVEAPSSLQSSIDADEPGAQVVKPVEKVRSRVHASTRTPEPRQVVMPDAPPAPSWPPAREGSVERYAPDTSADYTELSEINRDLNLGRARLFHVSGSLKDSQRRHAIAELAYKRAMRRALLRQTGGTAETRKAMAEIECESLENEFVIAAQYVDEMKRLSADVRSDLGAIESVSHNLRAITRVV